MDTFSDHERQLRRFRATLGLAIGSVLMPLGAILDLALYPEQSGPLIALRVLTTLGLVIGLVVIARTDLGRWLESLTVGLVLAPALAICAMLHLCDGVESNYFYGLILLMIVVHLLGFGWQESLCYCLATIATYLVAVTSRQDFSLALHSRALTEGLFFLSTSGTVCIAVCFANRDNRHKSFQLQQQARKQAQQRVDFFADVSHELRTPLTLISAPLDDLLHSRVGLEENVGQQLAIMRRNVSRLQLLVDDVLDVVCQPDAEQKVQHQELDLRELLTEVVTLASGAAHSAEMTIDLSGVRSPVMIQGDPNQIERVVLNLIRNAMKFSPSGGTINIHLDVRESSAWIEVIDQGPGVPEEVLDQVFRRHYQADNIDTINAAKGLGLGLAIAKQIIDRHHGNIDVINQPQGGAKFRVQLPLAGTTQTAGDHSPPRQTGRAPQHLSESTIHQTVPMRSRDVASELLDDAQPQQTAGTVLVIDDEPELRSYLAQILKVYYDVHVAPNATEGIRLAQQIQPDCILLDLMLPDSHHLSTLAALCDDQTLIDTKILMLTANADESIKLDALKRGSDDFLAKPFGTAELIARVDGLVRNARLQGNLRKQQALLTQAMVDLQLSEAKLLQSEKMRAIAQLAGGLLHEINNPINYTTMAVKVLKRQTSQQPELDETVDDIHNGLTRISDVIEDLRQFAHPESVSTREDFSIADVIRTAIRFASGGSEDIEVVVDENNSFGAVSHGAKSQAIQVMVNLLTNSMRAIGGCQSKESQPRDDSYRGLINIGCHHDADRIFVTVADNGCGMTDEEKQRIFEPFFTSGREGGLGLGVHLCQAIVADHGGQLTFQSTLGEGTQATFDLPLVKIAGTDIGEPAEPDSSERSHGDQPSQISPAGGAEIRFINDKTLFL